MATALRDTHATDGDGDGDDGGSRGLITTRDQQQDLSGATENPHGNGTNGSFLILTAIQRCLTLPQAHCIYVTRLNAQNLTALPCRAMLDRAVCHAVPCRVICYCVASGLTLRCIYLHACREASPTRYKLPSSHPNPRQLCVLLDQCAVLTAARQAAQDRTIDENERDR